MRAPEEIPEDAQGEPEGQEPGGFAVSKHGLPMREASRGSKRKKLSINVGPLTG